MPSYAILGSTGNVGSTILEILRQSSDNEIHAFCRSKQKLLDTIPGLDNDANVKVFEGSLADSELLSSCLRGTCAVFLTIAVQGNQPGCSVAQDTAHSVISSLEQMKTENESLPKLVVLSAAPTDHRLMADTPKFLLNVLYCAFKNIYDDLKAAELFIRSKDSLVSATFVKPSALTHDTQKGHVLSLQQAKAPLSFGDLAAGMIELADDETGCYDVKVVAVNPIAKDMVFPWRAPLLLFKGLIVYCLPWTYRFIG